MFVLHNASAELLNKNLAVRGDKVAFIDDDGSYTYAELGARVDRFAGFLRSCGIPTEARILVALLDGIDFVVATLGAIKAGIVPVMTNPLLKTDDYEYLLSDSRPRALIVSSIAWDAFARISPKVSSLQTIVMSGGSKTPPECISFASALASTEPWMDTTPTRADDPCLWQYSSGSTGRPKSTIHVHGAVTKLGELFPRSILDLSEKDITFSAAKLFFGYGFGNGLVFPLTAGSTSILMAERPTAASVAKRLREHRPTVFYGVPTLYNLLLAATDELKPQDVNFRVCVSSGEAMPPDIGCRWRERFGTDLLEGVGSTEMLHIFLSNRIADVRYGTAGFPLDGFELKLLDESGLPVNQGEIGELYIKGPTVANGYWCNREKSQKTFLGEWVRSGDRFLQDISGRYVYCGRTDDMLKVGGIFVSPFEIEIALRSHPDVVEAAVVGWPDAAALIKPKAFVVLKPGAGHDEMSEILRAHVRDQIAHYKCPRWFEFVEALPKTATGKIQRFKLRPQSAHATNN